MYTRGVCAAVVFGSHATGASVLRPIVLCNFWHLHDDSYWSHSPYLVRNLLWKRLMLLPGDFSVKCSPFFPVRPPTLSIDPITAFPKLINRRRSVPHVSARSSVCFCAVTLDTYLISSLYHINSSHPTLYCCPHQ